MSRVTVSGSDCSSDSSRADGSGATHTSRRASFYSPSPFVLPPDEEPVASAARGLNMAWKVLHTRVPAATLKKSFLAVGSRMSSSCTGVYTAEMGMSVIAKVVNESMVLAETVSIRSMCCHVPPFASIHKLSRCWANNPLSWLQFPQSIGFNRLQLASTS